MAPRRTAAEIVEAVGAAAHRLILARGPAAVSLREVAAEAGVNLGLIHRYVGSKDDVVALVLDRHGESASAALAEASGLDELLDLLVAAGHSSGRLFAGILLDDIDAVRLKRDFPVTAALIAALQAEAPWTDAETIAAMLQSLVLGWEVFSPFLLGAAGVARPAGEQQLLRTALEAIVDGARPDA